MASCEVRITRSAARELELLGSKRDRRRIVKRVRALAANPRPPGCEKLSGADRYRVRQGNYRIVYLVDDERSEVIVVKMGDRKAVYR